MAEKKLKVVEKVTQKMVMDKMDELINMAKEFDGDKASAAAHICFESINWLSYNYYEALGILEETKNMYIKACEKVDAEESEKGE